RSLQAEEQGRRRVRAPRHEEADRRLGVQAPREAAREVEGEPTNRGGARSRAQRGQGLVTPSCSVPRAEAGWLREHPAGTREGESRATALGAARSGRRA